MTTELQKSMAMVQALAHEAYLASGGVMALLDTQPLDQPRLAAALDKMAAKMETSTVEFRGLCEYYHPRMKNQIRKPSLPQLNLVANTSITEAGWLHIVLNTLLPHCDRQVPVWLIDTIRRILDSLECKGGLPHFTEALLVVDEHCDVKGRNVFDQDNKGWKGISNAMKGRIFDDDDQFTLHVALLSTRSEECRCHIYVLPQQDAGDFFYLRSEGIRP